MNIIITHYNAMDIISCNILFLLQEYKVQKKLKKKLQDTKKDVPAERKKKPDPLFEIEGNQKLNKLKKLQFKKEKKERARRGMMKNEKEQMFVI